MNHHQKLDLISVPSHYNVNQVLQHSTPIRPEPPLPETLFDKNNDSTIRFGHKDSEKQCPDVSTNQEVKSKRKGKFR